MADPMADEVQEVPANQVHGRLNWTSVMSGFVLCRFTELVAEGVKTDKGFKDVHLNKVARDLTEFGGVEISGSQVYNHLRKWRARWVKICRLKELSGAGWDEELCMITLDPEHYAGHVKDHPKDDEFLNVPLVNYPRMQAIFGSGVATGRFAMDSNEPLGDPADAETMNVGEDAPAPTEDGDDTKGNADGQHLGKRKRVTAEDGSIHGLTEAVWGFAGAVTSSAPGIVKAVMGCTSFSKAQLMFCLDHLMEHKASALGFLDMDNEEKDLWLACHPSKHGMLG